MNGKRRLGAGKEAPPPIKAEQILIALEGHECMAWDALGLELSGAAEIGQVDDKGRTEQVATEPRNQLD